MNSRNPKVILGLILLGILLAGVIILLPRVLQTANEVAIEKSLTPTPLPPWGNVMAVTPDPDAPTPEPLLRNGSTGQVVTDLQARLATLGYYSGEIDGQFGPGTRDAVVLFQQENNLVADGLVGSETKEILFSANAKPYVIPASPTPEP